VLRGKVDDSDYWNECVQREKFQEQDTKELTKFQEEKERYIHTPRLYPFSFVESLVRVCIATGVS
jgi:hypothetical protein